MEFHYLSGKSKARYNEFAEFLGPAISKGRILPSADNDINYTISLQHQRIIKKGLDVEYILEPSKNASQEILDVFNRSDAHYDNKVSCREYYLNRSVTKDGQTIYKDRHCYNLYETCSDLRVGENPQDLDHSCPNCGAVSRLSELQHGCPHCGTSYMMDDLYPKVTGYYLLDWPDSESMMKNWKRSVVIGMIAMTILMFVCVPIIRAIKNIPLDIGTLILIPVEGAFIGAVIGGLYFPLFWGIGHLIRAIGLSATTSTFDSRRKFERKMKHISPEFSCDFFMGKAVSLIRAAVFSEDEKDLLFYTGPELDPYIKDIIDLNYGGAFSLEKLAEKEGFVDVTLRFFMHVLYLSDGKVSLKKQLFRAGFRRRTDIPINYGFSMTRIECPSCGASFNAILNKHCLHCGREYEVITDDWVMTQLTC